MIEIDKLIAYEDNPRINEPAIEPVVKSIEKFGFNNPILTDQNLRIVAGHTRLEAAKRLLFKEVPVVRLELTEKQFKAYNIADNKTAELSEWDELGLSKILKNLKDEDEELLPYLGFEDTELEHLLSKIEEEESPKEKVGEVDKLGKLSIQCPKCKHKFEKKDIG